MSADALVNLERRVRVLEAEAEVRRVQARYMALCDTPCPDPAAVTVEDRINLIMDLYAKDAVWEGVGEYYNGQFGRCEGAAAIRAHFERFWGQEQKELVLNVHYLTSEHIRVEGDTAHGQWVHQQPWLYSDGRGLLRSSRLSNLFRRNDERWLITRTRTENVLIAPLPANFASHWPHASRLLAE